MDLHRYVMERHLGRKLKHNEEVHHINGDRYDNRLDNLEMVITNEHKKIHALKLHEERSVMLICEYCYEIFTRLLYKCIMKKNGSFYCSQKCSGKATINKNREFDSL